MEPLIPADSPSDYLTGRWLGDLANFSAFVFHRLPGLNWAGFYLHDGREALLLGPFSGKPACTEIRVGRGVCGSAFLSREALLVADVDEFPGHIRCDGASRSEMVLPLVVDGDCVGVFDLDSPERSRFREEDQLLVAEWVENLLRGVPGEIWKSRPWCGYVEGHENP